ncbi:MAG: hypothetical protein EOM47_02015 [Bacteroidia bacterium]|nr:hypothetical protein [Bacteroidia bacterium]
MKTIQLTKEAKVIMLHALKTGTMDERTAQKLFDSWGLIDPFKQMRLNAGIIDEQGKINVPFAKWADDKNPNE